MKNNKIDKRKAFIRFLKELGLFNSFVKAYTTQGNARLSYCGKRKYININMFLEKCCPEDYINYAFLWDETEISPVWERTYYIWAKIYSNTNAKQIEQVASDLKIYILNG